ncbi:MAG: hypothetical protein HON51_06145 [Gammaproteobacteria bacterium]|jgi:hypothetical protein|nr:hypothetical protein [Gammaproteobacteria bacterium]MBT5221575.1 hypothetical protein [Gammaproteobacteria bacterium]MBT5824783.1 hypothetical protein [Gammaproteobacteria bacterium]MBT6419854.1 hypothetical protein [Gammaproteobacteria bacterium]MBT6575796.1 hypothetical protein [Gammaproteobacteria bacterium]
MFPESFFHRQNNTRIAQVANFIKAAAFRQYDKKVESERQMLFRVTLKFITLIVLISIFDSLLDLFLELFDLLINLLHLFIEAIEYMLELLLVYILHTNTQQSETIIVNTVIIIALFLAYRLLPNIPQLYIHSKRNFRAVYLRHIKRESSCWRTMSLRYKIKWCIAHSLGTTSFLLLM